MSSGDPGDPVTGGGGIIDTGGEDTSTPAPPPPLVIVTTSPLPPATQNEVSTATIDTANATGPVTFTVVAGALPTGTTIDPATGVISGTPTTVETAVFTVQAVDSTTTTSAVFSLEVRTATGAPGVQFNQNSLAAAAQQLAITLRNPNNSYWCAGELYNAIIESLRIFQALTGYYRERAAFSTVANTPFYNLRTEIPAQYAFTVTDDDLLAEIQAHLLEPVANPWTGTDQFSITSILSAMENVRDAYLFDSGVYVTRQLVNGPAPPVSRVDLPQSVIHVRRAGWKQST